jgi:type III secretory pathway component EscS
VNNCGSGSAATHNGSSNKRFVVLTWTAPTVAAATNVKFVFTVVQQVSNSESLNPNIFSAQKLAMLLLSLLYGDQWYCSPLFDSREMHSEY